uniref:Uncharacterized protein n=2 Tax=viral metagenome TaxID=1070528 RepID=A0A6M3JA28_9ZZZZ
MVTRKDGITRTEKCPDCSTAVVIRFDRGEGSYNKMVLYNLDGTQHHCESARSYDRHPIGQAVTGAVIKRFELRGRQLTITMEDDNVLTVVAGGRPLTIRLEGPEVGVLQE